MANNSGLNKLPDGKYVASEPWSDGDVVETDLLIIGSGFAGMWAAISAADEGVKDIVVADKAAIGNSSNASMTLGTTIYLYPQDDKEKWMEELVGSAEHLSRQDMWDDLLSTSYSKLKKLESWGLKYADSGPDAIPRIKSDGNKHVALSPKPTWNGLVAGKAVAGCLQDQMLKRKGIRYFSKTMITRLLKDGDKIAGAVGVHRIDKKAVIFKAKAVIISTGQCSFSGQHAIVSTHTGDGYTLAYDAGATLNNMEFLAFDIDPGRYPLEGGSLLGTFGCKLINKEKQDFMWGYDPEFGSNAAVRVSTRAMAKEVKAGRGPIAMDYSSEQYARSGQNEWRSFLQDGCWQKINEFRIFEVVNDAGKEPEPFYAFSFGIIGAVRADVNCGTDIPGLYVAGITLSQDPGKVKGCESARAMWSGEKSGKSAALYIKNSSDTKLDPDYAEKQRREALEPLGYSGDLTPDEVLVKIQEIVFNYEVSILKSEEKLKDALMKIIEIKNNDLPRMNAADPHELAKYHETKNLVCCAELYLLASLERKESRECHYREDYPEKNNSEWLKWINLKKGPDGAPRMSYEEVPVHKYPIKLPEEV